MIRLEVDTAFNCRPKKGERRAKDGTGRLVKSTLYFGRTLEECLADARTTADAGEAINPGYAEVIEVRAFDKDTFDADPLAAEPMYKAAGI